MVENTVFSLAATHDAATHGYWHAMWLAHWNMTDRQFAQSPSKFSFPFPNTCYGLFNRWMREQDSAKLFVDLRRCIYGAIHGEHVSWVFFPPLLRSTDIPLGHTCAAPLCTCVLNSIREWSATTNCSCIARSSGQPRPIFSLLSQERRANLDRRRPTAIALGNRFISVSHPGDSFAPAHLQ